MDIRVIRIFSSIRRTTTSHWFRYCQNESDRTIYPDYFNSLPIQHEEVRESVKKYNLTNKTIEFDDIIQTKRQTLKEVNNSLKKFCCHRIIDGDFNLSYKENKSVHYCVLCMNFF